MKPYRDAPTRPGATASPRTGRVRLSRKRSRAPRIVLLCGLIVVLFWACKQLNPGAGLIDGLLLGWLALAFAVAVGVGIVWRRAVPLARENKEAVAQLLAGDVDGAARVFESLIVRGGRVPGYRAQFMANLGVALYRRGDTADAIGLLEEVYESGWLSTKRAKENWLYLVVSLGAAHIVRGDPNSRDLERADELRVAARPLALDSNRGLLVLVDALFAARSCNFKEVEAVCSSGWAAAEGVARPVQMRTLRILRAFALEQVDGGSGGPNDALIRSFLEGARPARDGEFDHLAGTWSAMRTFLDAHGFAAPQPGNIDQ